MVKISHFKKGSAQMRICAFDKHTKARLNLAGYQSLTLEHWTLLQM